MNLGIAHTEEHCFSNTGERYLLQTWEHQTILAGRPISYFRRVSSDASTDGTVLVESDGAVSRKKYSCILTKSVTDRAPNSPSHSLAGWLITGCKGFSSHKHFPQGYTAASTITKCHGLGREKMYCRGSSCRILVDKGLIYWLS